MARPFLARSVSRGPYIKEGSHLFQLDLRLAADSVALGDLPLCHVRLHRDANYPWVLLIPRRAGLTELYQLSAAEQATFMGESTRVARALVARYQPDKLNVANLGNVVAQLHIHHIARFRHDAAWPGPVWGRVAAKQYEEDALAREVAALRELLAGPDFSPAGA